MKHRKLLSVVILGLVTLLPLFGNEKLLLQVIIYVSVYCLLKITASLALGDVHITTGAAEPKSAPVQKKRNVSHGMCFDVDVYVCLYVVRF